MLGAHLFADGLTQYIRAGSQSCSPEILEELANSDIDRIRARVAENPNTPTSALRVLARDRNPDVRIAVGVNPSTPADVRQVLAQDENDTVRLGLAEDVSCPLSILEVLAQDSNPYISCRAEQTKTIILSSMDKSSENFFVELVRNSFDAGPGKRCA